jgi:hypothetical protein
MPDPNDPTDRFHALAPSLRALAELQPDGTRSIAELPSDSRTRRSRTGWGARGRW